MNASTLLRAARTSSGIGQSELARRAGTSQPDVSLVEQGKRNPTVETLERLLKATGHKLVAIRSNRPDAVESADSISSALQDRDAAGAFRRFLDYSDGLAAAVGVDRVVLTVAEPNPSGSQLWDAALAAVAEFWLDDAGLPKPAWLNDARRTLAKPRPLFLGSYELPPDEANVPEQFARRNVLLERGTLASI